MSEIEVILGLLVAVAALAFRIDVSYLILLVSSAEG